jgi:hypothetical protein
MLTNNYSVHACMHSGAGASDLLCTTSAARRWDARLAATALSSDSALRTRASSLSTYLRTLAVCFSACLGWKLRRARALGRDGGQVLKHALHHGKENLFCIFGSFSYPFKLPSAAHNQQSTRESAHKEGADLCLSPGCAVASHFPLDRSRDRSPLYGPSFI